MTILKKQYEELVPTGDALADVVVLAQAWKKSHAFIRRHNWYSDVLELDTSTFGLEDRLAEWSEELSNPGFRPSELKVVLAPKNARWVFEESGKNWTLEDLLGAALDELDQPKFSDWRPKFALDEKSASIGDARPQELRPLAHMSIRDQTLSSAVMMCLAEPVETLQGDSSESDVMRARALGIVSYGNRLQCFWTQTDGSRARARFSWGNSRTYRQYFEDYRTFLSRPRKICEEFAPSLPQSRELFVVSLDIKAFFDSIDVNALHRELRRLNTLYRRDWPVATELNADDEFWARAVRIMSWQWRADDQDAASLVLGPDAQTLALGLPQGMVSAGFFANAYLVGLDARLSDAANRCADIGHDIRLVDYVRYVDDIRLVVDVPSQAEARGQVAVRDAVETYFEAELTAHKVALGASKNLELASQKTSITPYRSLSPQNNISAVMEIVNAELSGTFDMESLAQAAGGLEGLLSMSEQIETEDSVKLSRLALASIAIPATDVRDDTVKRFVATRLAQVLRQRLAMTDLTFPAGARETIEDGPRNGTAIVHEFESTARKLIKAWADNPSLALLLRCGVDLFPHPRLLAPVVEALSVKLFNPPTKKKLQSYELRQVRVAEYVAADLFRAGAVETGYRNGEEYPATADIAGYREDLGVFARRIITERLSSPWYLLQQANLFLASLGDLSLANAQAGVPAEVGPYLHLQQVMLFQPVASQSLIDALPLALVAQQLQPNPRRFGVWLAEALRLTDDEEHMRRAVMTVALNRPDLVIAALTSRSSKVRAWRRFVPPALLDAMQKKPARKRLTKLPAERPLLRIMSDTENVFAQENGLLMLARALLKFDGIEQLLANGLSVDEISLWCADWGRLLSLPQEGVDATFLRVSKIVRNAVTSPLYETPPWVAVEKAWLYGLGRILRAAVTGEFDYTSKRFLVTEDLAGYTGLRSTWFKRRFGLLNSSAGVLDEPGPLSPWLSALLSTLLQWPGVEFRVNTAGAASQVRSPGELLALIEQRIEVQRGLFGSRSNTPMYVVPTDDDDGAPLQDRSIRVAIVQPMRPRREDFDVKDPLHWTAPMLAQHRKHLAEVCRLTSQKLKTWASAHPADTAAEEKPVVDVILFPELAVHPEHVSLLRRLSDSLGANIFAGLTFVQSPKLGAPVNQGIWLVRTESRGRGRAIQYIWQGKKFPTKPERQMGIEGHRPHLTLVELPIGAKARTRMAAVICYDATDLDLVADLRDRSDMLLVAALNQDVQTFDNMVAALHFHMYQPVLLANSGEFGGSTAQAPLLRHERLIAHVHGNNQVAVSVFEVDPAPFKSVASVKPAKELKTPPAGYTGRPRVSAGH